MVAKKKPGPRQLLIGLVTTAMCGWAWPLAVGVKGGAPVTAAFDAANVPGRTLLYGVPQVPFEFEGYRDTTRRFTVGPALELALPRGFGIEFNALYKPLDYQWRMVFINTPSSGVWTQGGSTAARRWEFPLLVKYRRPIKRVSWFVAAGPSFGHISGVNTEVTGARRGLFDPQPWISSTTTTSSAELAHRTTMGLAIGGGIEMQAGLLRFTPEVRYTRWRRPGFEGAWEQGFLRSNLNQIDILVGVSIGGRRR